MFPLWGLALGLVVGWLRGGTLTRLATLELKAVWLIFVALVLQLLIFPTPWFPPLISWGTTYFHFASYALVVLFFSTNYRMISLWTMALGMVINAVVITANGGYMPASVGALRAAGKAYTATQLLSVQRYANAVLMDEHTRLNVLGDWLYVPTWVPLANAFSLGDTVLMVGLAWLVQSAMVGHRGAPA